MVLIKKKLYVATFVTATIIINYANDVAGVWDRVVRHYRELARELKGSVPNTLTHFHNDERHPASRTLHVTPYFCPVPNSPAF